MKRVSLTVVGGVHAGRQIPLPIGNFLVGREQDCQLRPQSDLVSRHHCVFKIDEYGARLRDLGSTNGTLLNGVRMTVPVTLKTGDRVTIGDLEFTVETSDAAPVETPLANEAAAALGQPDSTAGGAETILEVDGANPGSETVTNLPVFDPAAVDTQSFSNGDSAVIDPVPPAAPAAPAPPAPMQQPQPQYPPPQQPQYNPYAQPGYPPMGYPQQQPMYPQPYPPQGMPYPQQPYPQQPYPQMAPQQPMAAPPIPDAAPPVADETPTSAGDETIADDIDVNLPPPAETGAKDAAVKGSAGAGVNKDDPSTRAADIIKQMQGGRRPGS